MRLNYQLPLKTSMGETPRAEKDVSGQPQCCAKNAGLTDKCIECKCVDCWNRPYEESENE